MIITLEGLDGSGKETISKVLKEKIIEVMPKGTQVDIISFPDYTSMTGKLIKKILSDPTVFNDSERALDIATLFILNRVEFFKFNLLSSDPEHIYIFDRYYHSNLFYQGIGMTADQLSQFANILYSIEFDVYKNPVPDVSFFLEVPYDTLRSRIDSRNVKNGVTDDSYEKDAFLKQAFHVSEQLMMQRIIVNSTKLFPQFAIACEGKTPAQIVDKIMTDLVIFAEAKKKKQQVEDK